MRLDQREIERYASMAKAAGMSYGRFAATYSQDKSQPKPNVKLPIKETPAAKRKRKWAAGELSKLIQSDQDIKGKWPDILRLARQKQGLTQYQAAELLGLNRPAIKYWETGKITQFRFPLSRLAQVYEIGVGELARLYEQSAEDGEALRKLKQEQIEQMLEGMGQ